MGVGKGRDDDVFRSFLGKSQFVIEWCSEVLVNKSLSGLFFNFPKKLSSYPLRSSHPVINCNSHILLFMFVDCVDHVLYPTPIWLVAFVYQYF